MLYAACMQLLPVAKAPHYRSEFYVGLRYKSSLCANFIKLGLLNGMQKGSQTRVFEYAREDRGHQLSSNPLVVRA